MRALSALVLALALVAPATARAERFAVGVALGTTHAETDADAGLNASSTSGLWLRYRLVPRLAAEIEKLSEFCKFRDCRHETEPGCAVTAAVAAGDLPPA